MSNIVRKGYTASTETLAEKRQVRVICSTAMVDRAGEVVVQEGIDLSAYRMNPVVLADHDPKCRVARCVDIGLDGGNLVAVVQFPPAGELAKSDQIYAEIKNGLLNGVSIGFSALDMEPMDKSRPKGPQKYLKSSLAEFSFVGVPANPQAVIVERSAHGSNWKVGASRNLPVDDGAAWDAEAAADSIFVKAGFDTDDVDTTFARKGFLFYDAANPTDRASYRLPFAKVAPDGRLTACAAGIAEAVKALKAEPMDGTTEKAVLVTEAYMQKTGKPVTKDAPVLKVKGLYDVARLAYLLEELGWIEECAEWEAEYEGDNSPVPAMLADAMRRVADALLAMTAEEVAELLGEEMPEGTVEEAVSKGLCVKDATGFTGAFAVARLKEGRRFSGATLQAMQAACDDIQAGHDKITSLIADATEGTDKAAAVDMTKAAEVARAKRMRELDRLRLAAV